MVKPAFQSQLDRSAVRFVLSEHALVSDALVLRGQAPLNLYDNTTALPRAYVTSRWQPVPDMAAAAEWMFRLGLDHPTVPATEGVPAPPEAAPARLAAIAVVERTPNHLTLDVSAVPEGLLVLTDTWDAGWSATVDGVPAEVFIANGYQRAVVLPAGAVEVVMRYWPVGLSTGLGLSLASVLLLLVWGVRTTKTGRALSSS